MGLQQGFGQALAGLWRGLRPWLGRARVVPPWFAEPRPQGPLGSGVPIVLRYQGVLGGRTPPRKRTTQPRGGPGGAAPGEKRKNGCRKKCSKLLTSETINVRNYLDLPLCVSFGLLAKKIYCIVIVAVMAAYFSMVSSRNGIFHK